MIFGIHNLGKNVPKFLVKNYLRSISSNLRNRRSVPLHGIHDIR